MNNNKSSEDKRPNLKIPLIAAAILCIAVAGWLLYPSFIGDGTQQIPSPGTTATTTFAANVHGTGDASAQPSAMNPTPGPGANTNSHFSISINGNVMHPGEYYVQKGSTLADAVELAGGFTDSAKTSELVMDKPLYDGEYIEIP